MRLKLDIPLSIRSVKRILDSPICGNDRDTTVTYISTDTRELYEKDLFFPIKGERFNGESFVDQAISLGATVVSTSNKKAHICINSIKHTWALYYIFNYVIHYMFYEASKSIHKTQLVCER